METPLRGGRITPGVVRVGDTVRRPCTPNSSFVRVLLTQLQADGFDGVPRYLGSDEHGREMFSYVSGTVPPELDPALPDDVLREAARLIRRFHDATAGTDLAGGREVVCHNDLSPCNFVFRDRKPIAIIDFDSAAPGGRLEDVGYALFLWLNLGTDGPGVAEQARRIGVFCAAYGHDASAEVVDAVVTAVGVNLARLRRERRFADAEWWRAQLDWLAGHREELANSLRRRPER